MQKVACPGCGAEVNFRSAASVMAVCEYCHTAILKEAGAVRDIGKIAPVFEDYSPLQIGTSGRWEKSGFTVVGRLQLKYGAGYWNEWRVLLDDGTDAWLSDASGQYVFTTAREATQALPRFEELRPGAGATFAGNRHVAADVRTARCVAGEGELPFRVGEGWELKAADFRWRDSFVTLDYSDGDTKVYAGKSVTLEGMKCQLLREPDDIKDGAGRYRGAAVPLNCPGCGSGIKYIAGMATHVVCPACHAEVDCAGEKAEVLAKHEDLQRVTTTLRPGDEGRIGAIKWTVIGLACHREVDAEEPSTWVEYLLFNPKLGLMWLVEAGDEWCRVKVLNDWPETAGDGQRFVGTVYDKLYEYVGEVTYAAGNFNWQVQVGDRVSITDYAAGDDHLNAERSADEITWSLSHPLDTEDVLKWFSAEAAAAPEPTNATATDAALEDAFARVDAQAKERAKAGKGAADYKTPGLGWPIWAAWIALGLFNANLLFNEEDGLAWLICAIAAWLVYLPAQIAKFFSKGNRYA